MPRTKDEEIIARARDLVRIGSVAAAAIAETTRQLEQRLAEVQTFDGDIVYGNIRELVNTSDLLEKIL